MSPRVGAHRARWPAICCVAPGARAPRLGVGA